MVTSLVQFTITLLNGHGSPGEKLGERFMVYFCVHTFHGDILKDTSLYLKKFWVCELGRRP